MPSIRLWVNCHGLLWFFSFPSKTIPIHYCFLMGYLEPVHVLVSHLGRCVFVVYMYLKVWWMGLKTGPWGWPDHCRVNTKLVSYSERSVWQWFFRYKTYIPYRYYRRELKACIHTKTCTLQHYSKYPKSDKKYMSIQWNHNIQPWKWMKYCRWYDMDASWKHYAK